MLKMNQNNAKNRAKWMLEFSNIIALQIPAESINWSTADYFFNKKSTAKNAASMYTLAEAIKIATNYMPRDELAVMSSLLKGEEQAAFVDLFEATAMTIRAMPVTYEQDGLGNAAIVHLHYFHSGSDWWITEKDKFGTGTRQAFGYACLNGDTQNAELGYISIAELVDNGVQLDLYWKKTTLGEVKNKLLQAA